MKLNSYFIFAILFSLISCQSSSQNVPSSGTTSSNDENKTFVDENWQPSSSSNAQYYLVKEYVEPVMIMEGVPTYEDGLQFKAKDTPLDRYLYNYYYKENDQLAFTVQVIALKENPEEYQFEGSAAWYKANGDLSAKGFFENGKLNGEYSEFDNNGNIMSTKRFMNGEEINVAENIYEPLLGTWVQETFDQSEQRGSFLYNIYNADGTLQIYTETYMEFNGKRTSLSKTNPSEFIWKYIEKDNGADILEVYYPDGKLLGIEKITFDGKDTFSGFITRHQTPAMVGEKYTFERLH